MTSATWEHSQLGEKGTSAGLYRLLSWEQNQRREMSLFQSHCLSLQQLRVSTVMTPHLEVTMVSSKNAEKQTERTRPQECCKSMSGLIFSRGRTPVRTLGKVKLTQPRQQRLQGGQCWLPLLTLSPGRRNTACE